MKLYTTVESGFTKEASVIPLSDNDTMWGSEILAALYKQHPYLGTYSVNLEIEGQDNGSGYLYGSFSLNNPNSVPPEQYSAGRVVKQEPPQEQVAKIPVIVEESKLYSFDVFIDPQGTFWPLTQENVDRALFSADNYTAVSPQEAKPLASGMNATPDIPNEGITYGNAGRGSNIKVSHVLEKAASAVPKEQRLEFVSKIEADPWLRACVFSTPTFTSALHKIATAKDETVPILDSEFYVLEKVAGGFHLYADHPEHGAISVMDIPNHGDADSAQILGLEKYRKEAIEKGAALIAFNPSPTRKVQSAVPFVKEASKTGAYVLMEKGGSVTKGTVLTDVVDLHGNALDLKLVVTPRGAALQEKVAGAYHSDIDLGKVSGSKPQGEGVFLLKTGSVTEPVIIENTITAEGNTTYVYSDSWGNRGLLKVGQCLRPTPLGDNNIMLPRTARFVSMDFAGGVISDPQAIDKTASAGYASDVVELFKHGNEYVLRGGTLGDGAYELNYATALFKLGKLGLSGSEAAEKLASAGTDPTRFIPTKKPKEKIKTASVTETVLRELNILLPADELEELTKAAAELGTDQDTVDSVLALNFVNPQNIQGFMEYLPQYEQCLNKLAELLIGARIGLPDVKESTILTTLRSLQKVVQGLKNLGLRLESMQQQQG